MFKLPSSADKGKSESCFALAPAEVPERVQTSFIYQKTSYFSSKFRFIRHRRSYTTMGAGVNLYTEKYKKDGKSYYLTTRSVDKWTKLFKGLRLPSGHSEQRLNGIRSAFLAKHGLTIKDHHEWSVTTREPCGHGPGMRNCRKLLEESGLDKAKIYYYSEYPDREDMRTNALTTENLKTLNKLAKLRRKWWEPKLLREVKKADQNNENLSETASEADEKDIVEEYESDYSEKSAVPNEKNWGLTRTRKEGFTRSLVRRAKAKGSKAFSLAGSKRENSGGEVEMTSLSRDQAPGDEETMFSRKRRASKGTGDEEEMNSDEGVSSNKARRSSSKALRIQRN